MILSRFRGIKKKGEAMDNLKEINKFINELWKFIKTTEIPAQNDDEAWEQVIDKTDALVADYKPKTPMNDLFKHWVVEYVDYMSVVSKGMPTLMQEAKEVVKGV